MEDPVQKETELAETSTHHSHFAGWLKRMGLAGFFFFLAKGLMWLLVPLLIAKGC